MATMRWEKTHLEDDQVTTEVFASAKLTAAKARATVSNLAVIVDAVVEARKAPTHIEIKEMTCDLPSSRINIGSVL